MGGEMGGLSNHFAARGAESGNLWWGRNQLLFFFSHSADEFVEVNRFGKRFVCARKSKC